MGQEQKDVEVKMLDGSIRGGVATGNNAAWLCVCGREQPMIGRTHEAVPKTNQVVECPNPKCGKIYHLYPENREDRKSVEFVKECKLCDILP